MAVCSRDWLRPKLHTIEPLTRQVSSLIADIVPVSFVLQLCSAEIPS